jgi:hypothetical protein
MKTLDSHQWSPRGRLLDLDNIYKCVPEEMHMHLMNLVSLFLLYTCVYEIISIWDTVESITKRLTHLERKRETSAVRGAKNTHLSAKARRKNNLRFFRLIGGHSYKSVRFCALFGEARKARGARRCAPDEFFYIQVQFIIIFKFNMTLKHLAFLI